MGSLPQLSIIKGPQREIRSERLHKIFETNLQQNNYGHHNAILYEANSEKKYCSYNELNRTSNQIARFITADARFRSAEPNTDNDWIVSVCMEPSEKLLITLLSIWKAGAAYLPLDPLFPVSRIKHILNDAKPILIIYDNTFNDISIFGNIPSMPFNEIYENSRKLQCTSITKDETLDGSKDDLGLVLYTSGSTGIPKGVRLAHSTVFNRLKWQWERFPYSDTESIGVFKTALTFVDSVCEIWSPLLNGLTLLVIPKSTTKDPEQLVHILELYKIERLVLVPTLLRSLLMYLRLNDGKKLLSKLRLWICSGEILSATLANDFFDYYKDESHVLCNFYGSTEIMGDVTYFVCENNSQIQEFEKIPIGYPIDNTVIYLLDIDYRPVKIGDIGEIFVSGLNLASGYVNGKDIYRFIENPLSVESKYSRLYKTGDFGRLNKGSIIYEGRTDSQIKVRGQRVDLSEIEKSVSTLPYIEKAVPLVHHIGEIDQALVVFVTLRSNAETAKGPYINGMYIENDLKDKLPSYMIPQVIVNDSIPLLVNGKVDRQKLLKIYETSNNNNEIFSMSFDYDNIPNNCKSIAEDLFKIISEVIGQSRRCTISLNSNFFELGGNSLNSIYTVTKLRDQGYFISITDFISAKNLRDILNIISGNNKIYTNENLNKCEIDNYKLIVIPLSDEYKFATIDIITTSFYAKADLEQWLKPDILITDYADILKLIWNDLVQKDLSFVVKDEVGQVIAVSLNFDAYDEPVVEVKNKLSIIFDFLEYLEGPIREKYLPRGVNKILHSFMMGTSEKLDAQQNIVVMHFMEHEVLKLAKRKRYVGILTTNTNPLTQQLGTSVYKYKTMLDYQVNQYVNSDGKIPFSRAPDSQRAIVHWKDIRLL